MEIIASRLNDYYVGKLELSPNIIDDLSHEAKGRIDRIKEVLLERSWTKLVNSLKQTPLSGEPGETEPAKRISANIHDFLADYYFQWFSHIISGELSRNFGKSAFSSMPSHQQDTERLHEYCKQTADKALSGMRIERLFKAKSGEAMSRKKAKNLLGKFAESFKKHALGL